VKEGRKGRLYRKEGRTVKKEKKKGRKDDRL
jgi:hypothetical protein